MYVGLGTGSTSAHFIVALGQRVREERLALTCVASSLRSEALAQEHGLTLAPLVRGRKIDLAVDGADEVSPELYLTKGGGGALLREKILAYAARKFVVIVDSAKAVNRLGAFPLPLEVLPMAWAVVADAVTDLGGLVSLRERDAAPFRTDQGNYVLDCRLGEILDPPALAQKLEAIPGVLGHGLFVDLADVVIFGQEGGNLVRERRGPLRKRA